MKKFLIIINITLLAVLTSCQKSLNEDYNSEYEAVIISELEVSNTSLELTSEEQSVIINVKCNSYWTISSSAGWLYFSSNQGKKDASISIMVGENYSTSEKRSATIVVTNGLKKITINVTQDHADEMLSLSKSSLDFSYDGGSSRVYVESNVSWSAESNVSWCSVSPSSSSFYISVYSNNSYSPRTAIITVTGNKRTQYVNVRQSAVKEPTVSGFSISDITKTSATCQFSYTSADIYVNQYGVCYSTTDKEPTKINFYKYNSTSSYSGTGTIYLTDLAQNTTYYVRPYVTTSCGTTYGKAYSFTTLKTNSPGEGDNPPPSY